MKITFYVNRHLQKQQINWAWSGIARESLFAGMQYAKETRPYLSSEYVVDLF